MSKKKKNKNGLVLFLFVSLVFLVLAMCIAALYKNQQELQERREVERIYQQQQLKEERAKEAKKQEAAKKAEEEQIEEDVLTEVDESFYVAENGVEVRQEANNDGEIIGTLKMDQVVRAVAYCERTKYYKIKINGDYGFVAEDMLSEQYIDIPLPISGQVTIPEATKDILFIGNSITCYPATADWWGSGWGCGASNKDLDYVHLTVSAKGYSSYDAMSMRHWEFSGTRNNELSDLDAYLSKYQYNTVVIELGENAKGNAAHLKQDLVDMVTYIHSYSPNARIVFMDNFWKFDDVISAKKAAASEVGATYVSLSDLWGVKDYQLQSGDTIIAANGAEYVVNDFLAGHPNDAGFAAMAQRLIEVL